MIFNCTTYWCQLKSLIDKDPDEDEGIEYEDKKLG